MGSHVSADRPAQPAMTTLVAQLHPQPYLIQWERVLRWRERTLAVTAEDRGLEAFDYAFALFTSIFQRRDWIRASRRDLEDDVTRLFRDSSDLALVRDLANGSKHMEVTSYSDDGAATIAREYAGRGEHRYVVPRPGGRNVEAVALADRCVAEIRSFMEARELL
jgi:hypothetical protein